MKSSAYAGGIAPNAVMLGHVRRIVWTSDGWPLVLPERYGAVPQVAISESDIVGKWKHIDLRYDYARQKEASPRTHTIVYAGLGDNNTYWGKKNNR